MSFTILIQLYSPFCYPNRDDIIGDLLGLKHTNLQVGFHRLNKRKSLVINSQSPLGLGSHTRGPRVTPLSSPQHLVDEAKFPLNPHFDVNNNANVVQPSANVVQEFVQGSKKITSCTNPLQLQINDRSNEYFFSTSSLES